MNDLNSIIEQWHAEQQAQMKREAIVCNTILGVLVGFVLVTIALWATV